MTDFEKAGGGGGEEDQKRFLELPRAKARQLKIKITHFSTVIQKSVIKKKLFLEQ